MRVANIIEDGRLAGPQIRMVMVALAIKDKVDTTIIMPRSNSEDFQKICNDKGVNYKKMPISRITKELRVALRYIFFSFFEVVNMAIYLKKENFDMVHISGGSWQYKGLIASKLAGLKTLWHINDTYSPSFIRRIFSKLSRYSDSYIFASERSKYYYKKMIDLDKLSFIIPAPVDTNVFRPDNEYIIDNEMIVSLGDDFIIGMVANINPIKGLENFIRMAGKLNSLTENIRFVVIGPVYKSQKKYFNRLKLLCDTLNVRNIEFIGGKADIRPFLKRFDVYVCSSLAESSPISVWEAMSMGKPIVSTDVGDVPLYVTNDKNGYIFDIDDHMGFARKINLLKKSKSLSKNFGLTSRSIAKNNLDIAICAKKHLVAYETVLNYKQ
jgi:glycosyltransferase involved in cell wall biosynthesis